MECQLNTMNKDCLKASLVLEEKQQQKQTKQTIKQKKTQVYEYKTNTDLTDNVQIDGIERGTRTKKKLKV